MWESEPRWMFLRIKCVFAVCMSILGIRLHTVLPLYPSGMRRCWYDMLVYASCTCSSQSWHSPLLQSFYDDVRFQSMPCLTWKYRLPNDPISPLILEKILKGSLSASCWSSMYTPHCAISVIRRECSTTPSLYLRICFRMCICRGHSQVRMYTSSFRISFLSPSMVHSCFQCWTPNFAVLSSHNSLFRINLTCNVWEVLKYFKLLKR